MSGALSGGCTTGLNLMAKKYETSADSAIIFLINQWSVWIVRVPGGQGVGLQGSRGLRAEAKKPRWQGGIAIRKVFARPESFCA